MLRTLLFHPTRPDDVAVIGDNGSMTYHDLAKKARALREQLSQEMGTHVAIFLPNGGDYISALFGTLSAGMVAFPLSVQLTAYELTSLLAQADVHTVVTSLEYQTVLSSLETDIPFQILCMEELKHVHEEEAPSKDPPSPDAPMLLLGTSGTTGKAKLVQLSEQNLEYCVLAYLEKMDYEAYQKGTIRYAIATPFSSSYGLLILMACLLKGFPIVLLGEPFTLSQFYQAAQDHQITHYEGGTSVAVLMDQTALRTIPYDLHSLRYFGLAGSKISVGILRRLSSAFPGVEFWTGYGMTEASPLIAKPYKRMDPDKFASVGTALPGEQLMVELNGQRTDAPYVQGEIVVKGPNVMLGYYHNQEETERIIREGYLHTGDIGYFDEDGYLYLCGRKKNIIIVRGFNVYPEEVESCLLNSGLVKECVVHGEKDGNETETVFADVVLSEAGGSEEALHRYCADHLAIYKRPQHIRIVPFIEKTATGKNKLSWRGTPDGAH